MFGSYRQESLKAIQEALFRHLKSDRGNGKGRGVTIAIVQPVLPASPLVHHPHSAEDSLDDPVRDGWVQHVPAR
jgi:hypothetical protein